MFRLDEKTFVETMCARNGVISLLPYHNERLNRTRREVFGCTSVICLEDIVNPDSKEPCLKVRVVYGSDGIIEVTYSPYVPKTIRTLRLITDDKVEYSYKSTDRHRLQALASMKEDCDEVLIVRNGMITDTSFTNVAVQICGEWLTPRHPLLRGTRRASLIDKGIIRETDIRPSDIPPGAEIMLFNGMMDFGTCKAVIKR